MPLDYCQSNSCNFNGIEVCPLLSQLELEVLTFDLSLRPRRRGWEGLLAIGALEGINRVGQCIIESTFSHESLLGCYASCYQSDHTFSTSDRRMLGQIKVRAYVRNSFKLTNAAIQVCLKRFLLMTDYEFLAPRVPFNPSAKVTKGSGTETTEIFEALRLERGYRLSGSIFGSDTLTTREDDMQRVELRQKSGRAYLTADRQTGSMIGHDYYSPQPLVWLGQGDARSWTEVLTLEEPSFTDPSQGWTIVTDPRLASVNQWGEIYYALQIILNPA